MTSFTPSLLFDATLLWFSTKYCKMAVTHQWRLSAPDVGYHLIYKCSTKCKLASKICFLTVTFHRANYEAIIFLQSILKILGTKIKIILREIKWCLLSLYCSCQASTSVVPVLSGLVKISKQLKGNLSTQLPSF